jgi:hypothetical protein
MKMEQAVAAGDDKQHSHMTSTWITYWTIMGLHYYDVIKKFFNTNSIIFSEGATIWIYYANDLKNVQNENLITFSQNVDTCTPIIQFYSEVE